MKKKLLRPEKHRKVIDLVEQAGIDVSDWANFKGGTSKASTNPKYCYDWSFVSDNNKIIVVNIWYEKAFDHHGLPAQSLNLRDTAKSASGIRRKRAEKMDRALKLAYFSRNNVRAIICDGVSTKHSGTVKKRILDWELWHVEEYSDSNGECLLVRGPIDYQFVDQFDDEYGIPRKNERLAKVYDRSLLVRDAVRKRAKGHCEYCGVRGFLIAAGSLYLETHHIVPLSDGGADTTSNVIALCPNDHREAHYGIDTESIQTEMLEIVSAKSARNVGPFKPLNSGLSRL